MKVGGLEKAYQVWLGLVAALAVSLLLGACTTPAKSGKPSGAKTPPTSSTPSNSTPSSTSSIPTSSSTSSPARTTTASACQDGQITVASGGGGVGLGHQGEVLLFTSTGHSPCTLRGYPGVAGLNSDGQQVVQAQRSLSGYLGGLWDNATTPPTVLLQPGGTGSAMVEGTDNPVGTATSCPYYNVLLVTPPNLTDSTHLTVTGLGNPPNTGLAGCSPIYVHPIVPGNTGRTAEPPVLGSSSAFQSPDARGFGQVAPSEVFFGGEAESAVTQITWASWGASRTTGTGTGCYSGTGPAVDCRHEGETVVASDLGTCDGTYMYQRLAEYFPEEGQTVDSAQDIDICEGPA